MEATTTEIINQLSTYAPNGVTNSDIGDYIIVFLIGALGGLVRELHEYYDAKMPTSFPEILFRMLSGAFVGFLGAEAVWALGGEEGSTLIWLVAAASAYSGYEIADMVLDIVKGIVNFVGKKFNEEKATKEKPSVEPTLPNEKPPLIENNG